MATVGIRGASYCLNHTPELAFHYGNTPSTERHSKPDSEFLANLPKFVQSYDEAVRYAPNLVYIGALGVESLPNKTAPMYKNLEEKGSRSGVYGEIMPEDEFIALMDICDVFDLVWLEESFSVAVKPKMEAHPLLGESQIKRLEAGHALADIEKEVAEHNALPLYFNNVVVACVRKGHDIDENLSAHVLMENLASKVGGVLALMHLIKNSGVEAKDIEYVIECSEEAIGDMNQRGGGNMAKAIAEIADCVNASGCDVRGFCAGPVSAILNAAGLVCSGIHKNVAVVAGGAIPKLYMNAREHVKKAMPALENCMGNFGVLLMPDDGSMPIIRLDAVGKHSVGVGAAPQAITSALVLEPLEKIGLGLKDVDKYAAELHTPEITVPAGAGNVPEANFKMIAALGVMKGQVERADMNQFVKERGMEGYAPTQGHIPSGVPFIGHAIDAINRGEMHRAMIIGKGSLFLGRLTNLADGASFIIEKAGAKASAGASISKNEVKEIILDVLSEITESLDAEAKKD